jgi:hypothetical protein
MDSSAVPQFANDLATTGTYRETLLHSRNVEPERKLMLAVLKDAFLKYKKHRRSNDRGFCDASRWFFESDVEHVFSFEHVCWILGLSSTRIRRHLLFLRLS